MIKMYCHPRCTTCKKAEKWLKEHNVEYSYHDITQDPFHAEDVEELHRKSEKPIKKLFNTSGKLYREQNMKDKVSNLTDNEAYEVLASSGMMMKRPILVHDDRVLVGFKEDEYGALFLND
ncbi:arsenate reductase family protein [Haloplasma contractile]|uniref:Arsenate reductase protein n=1 Tax=Haloplasma contractile SSD-17B TaxID=1033810 RepID=U2EDF2_9MOLU|nr:arsenate reductase family protein [Haloplasma contractile]ERJ13008.1 Arsenate reductase protein [Haloplasma contractile SSD-17B]